MYRSGVGRKALGALVCGASILLLTVGTAAADDKLLEELKARLDKLEKQNEELKEKLKDIDSAPAPYKAGSTSKDKASDQQKEKEKLQKAVDAYLKEKDTKKKVEDEKKAKEKAQEKEDAGYEIGKQLGITAKWDNHAIWFRTEDNAFNWHLGGWADFDNVAVDGPQRMFQPLSNNGIGRFDDGVNFRRIRIRSEGTVYDQFDFLMEFDFSLAQRVAMPGNTVNVTGATGTINSQAGTVGDRANQIGIVVPTDMWGQIRDTPIGNIRFGNQKPLYSMEQLMSSRFIDIMEFSYIWDAFLEQGNNGWIPGVGLWGNFGELNGRQNRFFWGAELSWSNNRDLYVWNVGDGELEETARFGWTILDECEGRRLLNLSVGSMHQAANDGQLRYRARFDLRNGNNLTQPTLAQIQGGLSDAWLVQPELFFNWGSFNVQAEYAWLMAAQNPGSVFTAVGNQTSNLPPGSRGELYYQGGYITLSYFLTGETRSFDRTWKVPDRVVPLENVFSGLGPGGWCFGRGAWQVLGRYNYLDLNSKGVNGGILNGFTLGLNWYLNPNMRFMFDTVADHRGVTQYGPGGVPTATATSPSGWLYGAGARFHFDF